MKWDTVPTSTPLYVKRNGFINVQDYLRANNIGKLDYITPPSIYGLIINLLLVKIIIISKNFWQSKKYFLSLKLINVY